MKKKTKKLIIRISFLIVAISMLLLFISGFLLGPDRRWIEPITPLQTVTDK